MLKITLWSSKLPGARFLGVWYGVCVCVWTFQLKNQLHFERGTRFWDAVFYIFCVVPVCVWIGIAADSKLQAITILPFQQFEVFLHHRFGVGFLPSKVQCIATVRDNAPLKQCRRLTFFLVHHSASTFWFGGLFLLCICKGQPPANQLIVLLRCFSMVFKAVANSGT